MNKTFLINTGLREIKTEVVRKSIHFSISFTPAIALVSKDLALGILGGGITLYIIFEALRISGVRVPLVSRLTAAASRPRDKGHFVLGPVTLGLGALLALICFNPTVSAIAIYALAFGDGFASLAGKLFGRIRPAFMYGKSVEGSLACFIAVYFAAFAVTGQVGISLVAAIIASMTEALPLDDFDNVCLPLTVGVVVNALMLI